MRLVKLQRRIFTTYNMRLSQAQNDGDTHRNKLSAKKKKALKLLERLTMVETNLKDRGNQIRSLKIEVFR